MSPLHVSTSSPLWNGLEPLLRRAREVDIAVAYATAQGAKMLLAALEQPLREGASVRLLVGCYLGGTRPEALHVLLGLDRCGARVSFIADPHLHFHPKVYRIIDGDGFEHLFVGSSNLSRSALCGGPHIHEWTLGLERAQAGSLLDEAREHLERLFADLGQRLTPEVIAAFEQMQLEQPVLPPAALLDPEEPPGGVALEPNEPQRQALDALAQARQQGHRRALVVAATGLGKTLLAAFDSLAVVPPGKGRVLVVAHRRGLLDQAAVALGRVRGQGESQGFVDQTDDQRDCDQVFVSVASLGRLSDAELRSFAYVVIDEAHHGTAASYRRLFDVTEPRFLLGLTATPERLDGGDVYGLFHGAVACEVNLLEGIQRGWLVPFAYHGVHDPIDYDQLSWTGGKLGYAPTQLDALLLSMERQKVVLAQMGDPRIDRSYTLVFCVSIAHAEHTASILAAAGWRVAQVHSGPGAHTPATAIDALRRRELQVLITVDMFNEGVDIPEVDRIVMLRPTDSPTVFLQQIGRGLRKAPPKERLLVIDLVGNHRRAVQRLAWLGVTRDTLLGAPLGQSLRVPLAGGSEVVLEVEALDAIRAVEKSLGGPRGRLRDAVVRLAALHGARPTLTELLAEAGLSLSTVRSLFGSWLGLLEATSHLTPDDQALVNSPEACALLEDVESTDMRGPHKMILLGAMAQAGLATVTFEQARTLSPPYAARFDPELWSSLDAAKFPSPYPVDILAKAHPTWCQAVSRTFSLALPVDLTAALLAAIAERAEARLHSWVWTRHLPGGIPAKVLKNGNNLCLKLDESDARKLGPSGTWVGLRLDGEEWFGKLVQEAINVIRREPTDGANQAREALMAWCNVEAVEHAYGRQVLLSPSTRGGRTDVTVWVEGKAW